MTMPGDERCWPKRIQRKRTKGWRMPGGAVCVDRSGLFGNPFPVIKSKDNRTGDVKWWVGTWGGPALWLRDTKAEAVELSVKAFRSWIGMPANSQLRDKAIVALRGKDLACWCALGQPCHADVLLELANNP